MFALYNMAGTFAMSAGTLLLGLPSILQQQYGVSRMESIKPLFVLYSALGIAVIGIYFLLSKKIELPSSIHAVKPLSQVLSPESKKIVSKLSGLFALDPFAGGFRIQSIVSFWFFSKFGVELTTLSYIFSGAESLLHFHSWLLPRSQTKLAL